MEEHKIVFRGGTGEIVEKKSRFIANVFSVETEEEALQLIAEQKKKYWDARHNCYAFVLGERGELTRCSDDGEPAGTAGRPILEVLSGADVCNVLVVVTRYFGGTLLGTGGLVRAYSQAAQAGLAASQIAVKQLGRLLQVETDYNWVGKIQYMAVQEKLVVMEPEYTDRVLFRLMVREADRQLVRKKITEATQGQAVIDDEQRIWFAIAQDGQLLLHGEL